jgi:hypothetical protein
VPDLREQDRFRRALGRAYGLITPQQGGARLSFVCRSSGRLHADACRAAAIGAVPGPVTWARPTGLDLSTAYQIANRLGGTSQLPVGVRCLPRVRPVRVDVAVLVAGFYGFVGLLVLRFNPWFVAAGSVLFWLLVSTASLVCWFYVLIRGSWLLVLCCSGCWFLRLRWFAGSTF